jgi:hypothetical protein
MVSVPSRVENVSLVSMKSGLRPRAGLSHTSPNTRRSRSGRGGACRATIFPNSGSSTTWPIRRNGHCQRDELSRRPTSIQTDGGGRSRALRPLPRPDQEPVTIFGLPERAAVDFFHLEGLPAFCGQESPINTLAARCECRIMGAGREGPRYWRR